MSKNASALLAAVMLISLGGGLLTGCKVGPDYKAIQPELPTHWKFTETEQKISGAEANTAEWWTVFNDPILTGLIDEALKENLSLQAAGMRVMQARSGKVKSWWLLAPAMGVSGQAVHTELSQNVKPDVTIDRGSRKERKVLEAILANAKIPAISVSNHINLYGGSVGAAWEPDIWGGKRRGLEESSAQIDEAIASYDDVVVVLTSEIAANYIELRTIDEKNKVLDTNIAELTRLEKKARARGGDSISDADLANSLLQDARATRVQNETMREIVANTLCVLVGRNPGGLDDRLTEAKAIPQSPETMSVGIPVDLLRRRPDVRMAERAAAAQCARIGRIKATLYPSFSLVGSMGFSSSETSNLLDHSSRTQTYGGLLNWNILSYPFIQEQARIADSMYHEALMDFQNTVLRAAAESQNAIVNVVNTRRESKLLAESAKSANASASKKLAAYEDGGDDFNGSFAALNAQVEQAAKSVDSQGASAIAVVRLYAALGGGWESQVGAPLASEETQAAMRKDTDWWTFGGGRRLKSTR